MKNRTNINYSEHELTIIKNESLESFHLKKPDTITCNVKFTNVSGVCLVTGDFGNWVFCRPFTPIATDQRVSDGYWCEKLEIGSVQKALEYDPDETKKEIESELERMRALDDDDDEKDSAVIDYFEQLLEFVECGEREYTNFAFDNYPEYIDWEDVPHCQKIKHRLLIIFDAFDEICKRMKTQTV